MDKEQLAIARLQEAYRMYKQPLVVTTSGEKDSSVCVALAERAGSVWHSWLLYQRGMQKRQIPLR